MKNRPPAMTREEKKEPRVCERLIKLQASLRGEGLGVESAASAIAVMA